VKDRARRYLLINATGLAARGVSDAAAIVGKTAFDYFEPDIAAAHDSEDARVIEQGISILNREAERVLPGGEKQWHLTTKLPLRDPRGEIVGMLGVNRDITEMRKRDDLVHQLNSELEQRVTERTAQLEAANKELESFAYSVSHDLRAPLRSIEGFSQALLEDYRDRLDEAGRDHLERVRAASQRMASLIDDLLSLSRFSRGDLHRVEVDLAALARRIVSDLRKEQPGRDVELKVPRTMEARADASLMYAVLDNLLRNAWKFTERRTHARIEVLSSLQGDLPCYCVRDNGVGFDMAYAGKLFGAFQRLHSASDFPGTGIGLATVQRIVHRHGGRVWAQAVLGEGATFCFTLGDAPRSGAAPAAGLPEASPVPGGDVTERAAPGDRYDAAE
jgi:signal transduction histidine kinase